MELEITDEGIIFEKELNRLDEFVLDFVSILDRNGIRYCFMSGYVALLFGRSRSTEDVDVFIEVLDKDRFLSLWNDIIGQFDCIITCDPEEAFSEYLAHGTAIRFARKGKIIPNIEVKFPKQAIGSWTLENRQRVVVGDRHIFISPMEVQIPYKLKLGSEKDIEDAVHLYSIFRDHLDRDQFMSFLQNLDQLDAFRRYLDEA